MSGPPSAPAGPSADPAATASPVVRLAALSTEPLSVDAVLAAVTGPGTGGVGLFVGLIRDHDGGRPVDALHYTAHPSAATALAACAAAVAERHGVTVAVAHRIGDLVVGDLAVVIATAAAHRGPALAACRDLIEDLKRGVPIWKEQHFTDGAVEWVGLP